MLFHIKCLRRMSQAILIFILSVVQAFPLAVFAAPDIEAPTIQHQGFSGPVPPGSLEITAKVMDDQGVAAVTLFYRTSGEAIFKELPMKLPKGGAQYQVTLPEDAVQSPGLEYYIVAEDQAGNSVMRGFSFDPLTVSVMPSGAAKVAQDSPTKGKNWLWIGLGALAVGALAAGGGGGGGGGGATTAATGAVEISAPVPQ